MDLGCLDLGCISALDKQSSETNLDTRKKECHSNENVSSATKTGKSKSPKGFGQSPALNALNKFTSQIKKPTYRRNSPINWFPRRKVDSYLKRKIKMLQEMDGMRLTLDETLGDSNPHYSRVLREKMAAREAANAAMEARKAALVEASWCKILRAARIQCKEAEAILLKAEKTAAEAFEAAAGLGVIMYDRPNCAGKPGKIETSMVDGGKSTTHTVTASFETAFDVDKEVAAAVKTSFVKLSGCPSFDKHEFKELLCKISQNPDMGENDIQEASEFLSECESESGSEFESMSKLSKATLVEMMLDRIRCLKEDELSSLATIVATCGLNAALAEEESSKLHDPADNISRRMSNIPRRMSLAGSGSSRYSNIEQTRRKQAESELPSLDKFLVKHMTKLEREVEEAKNSRRTGAIEENTDNNKTNSQMCIPDLGSILVKHSSKFEKEIEEAKKKNSRKSFEIVDKKVGSDLTSSEAIPDLGSMLIKHSSMLQKEVQQIRKSDKELETRAISRRKEDVPAVPSLDKFLVKHVSRLEKEVQEAKNRRMNHQAEEEESKAMKAESGKENIDKNKPEVKKNLSGLDKVLVKHVSRLEKDRMGFSLKLETSNRNKKMNEQPQEGSLDQILVKHQSKLEREKMAAGSGQPGENLVSLSVSSRREARERELQQAWGGLSLGNSIKPHISKLEKDKAAWIKAEEEERRRGLED